MVAWSDDNGAVHVGWPATGKTRTLFSPHRPDALFAALKSAKRPDRVRALLPAPGDAALRAGPNNWQTGTPTLAPDGKTVFFAANAGLGMGASGNTSFAFFAADVATGKLAVLSKLGALFGRVPWSANECQVSPDGQRLLFVTSAHNMAVDNPRQVFVVDLLTQEKRELLAPAPHRANDTNLTEGACWSPDGRFVAVSALFYDVAAVLKKPHWEPRPGDYTLFVFDAGTGRVVRRVPGATRPTWSRG